MQCLLPTTNGESAGGISDLRARLASSWTIAQTEMGDGIARSSGDAPAPAADAFTPILEPPRHPAVPPLLVEGGED